MIKNILTKYSRRVLLILIAVTAILICIDTSYAGSESSNLIVYGNEKCGYCKETMRWLDSKGILYVYKDVELYGTNQEEMFLKLDKAGFTSTAYFPVIDVNGQILMKPEFDDITKALAGSKINTSVKKKIRETTWRPQKNRSSKTDFDSIKKRLSAADLIFYDDGSGSGKTLLNQLKKEQIPFTLKQLNKLSNAAYFDMSSRLSALGYGNITLFPVVEVRGEMIMKPSIEDVKLLLIEMVSE